MIRWVLIFLCVISLFASGAAGQAGSIGTARPGSGSRPFDGRSGKRDPGRDPAVQGCFFKCGSVYQELPAQEVPAHDGPGLTSRGTRPPGKYGRRCPRSDLREPGKAPHTKGLLSCRGAISEAGGGLIAQGPRFQRRDP